jgi:hypothetical protein
VRHQLHHGGVQLVLVTLRCGAAFEVADRAAFLGNDERALELPGVACVDAEVRGQLHRAFHPLGDIDKGAIREHRRVQRSVKVVAHRHHAAQVALDEFRVVLHRVRERAEDHTHLGELLAEGGAHGHRIEHRIHRHPGQACAFVQGHAQLFVGFEQLGVHLVQALGRVLERLGRRVVRQRLEVHRRHAQVRPVRWLHAAPALEGRQAPLQQKGGLTLLARDGADGVFVQSRRQAVGFDVGGEAVRVWRVQGLLQGRVLRSAGGCGFGGRGHGR